MMSFPSSMKEYRRRWRDRFRWPTMLEIFTVSALVWGLWFEQVMVSWTFAILALAWSRFHNEEKEGDEP